MKAIQRALPPLPRSFYDAPPDQVARRLLGKVLVHHVKSRDGSPLRLAGRLTELEAYMGLDDPAAHSFAGPTERNAVLFGPPGFAYIYFIYGMHYCANVACEAEGKGSGILFRAMEPLAGIEEMARLRGLPPHDKSLQRLACGPGRLCQAMGITRPTHNGFDLTSPTSALQIVDDGFVPERVETSPRIGIRKAEDRPLRFVIAGHACVSRK